MSVVERELSGGVLTLRLNRPEAMNAITGEMLTELADQVAAAGSDREARVVVITGTGKAFCAGQDLKELPEEVSFQEVLERYNRVVLGIAELDKPVIAGINGAAAGAGLSLALACDLRVAAESASLVTAFSAVGLTADSGMSYTLPRLVGWGKAYELLVLSPRLTAGDALGLGLVNQVATDDTFPDTLRSLAERLATGPTRAFGFLKRALQTSANGSLREVLNQESNLQELAGRTRDAHEGITAFRERRRPNFTGE
ncbi:MAG TPA: enoyl-CoA hydratase-related protein [Thermomicrobiaceae bacterium]|nr:enoyl-CoA hydratase-related protein [Thermomicrobiaceae bacterium]